MPRKTKKQKIVSDYRRRIAELSFQPSSPVSFHQKVSIGSPKTLPSPKKQEVNQALLEENKWHIVGDLKKTVLWSAVAISAEVVLYFVT